MAPRADQHLEAEDLLALERGDLPELTAATMRRHLTDCPECRHVQEVVRARHRELSSVLFGASPTGIWESVARRAVEMARLAAPTPVLSDRLSRWLETHPGRAETALRVRLGSAGAARVDATGLETVALAGAQWRLAPGAPRDAAYVTRFAGDTMVLTADLEGARTSTRIVVGPGREIDVRISKDRPGTPAPLVVVAPIAGGKPRVELSVRTNDVFAAHFANLPEDDLLVLVEPISDLA